MKGSNMKTIILYATKYGATAEIAKRIADRLEDATIHDLKQGSVPQLSDFECVIIGSSVYIGSFRKEAKAFIKQNADELCKKKLGLFISAMSELDDSEAFKANIPKEVLQEAFVTGDLGGVFDPKKGNCFERLIMKLVTKQSGYVNTISEEKIIKFTEAIKAQVKHQA